jgi:uncharacterized protein
MPEVTERYAPGVPCWADAMVPERQRAINFYTDLFGWRGEAGGREKHGYSICTLHGRAVGGVMAATTPDGPPMPPPSWAVYLATDDVDSALYRISVNDGTVLVPGLDVPDLGRMGVAQDPTGAVFGLWQARQFIGAQIVNEYGAVVWNELNTSDVETATSFYRHLGIEVEPMEGGSGYYALNVGGRTVGGLQSLENAPPGTSSHWLTYFAVEDTDSTVDVLIRAGGSVLVRPFDMTAGRMAVVQDPQGPVFAVIAPITTGSS